MVRKRLAVAAGIGVRNSKPALVRNRVCVMSVPGFEPRVFAGKRRWRGAAIQGLTAVALAGCATQTAQQHYNHGHEYFSQAKYGDASRKVVADGQPRRAAAGNIWSAIPIRLPATHTTLPRTRPIQRSGWPPVRRRFPRPTNRQRRRSTTWRRRPPPIPQCRCQAMAGDQHQQRLFDRRAGQRSWSLSRRAAMDVSSRVADVLDFKGRARQGQSSTLGPRQWKGQTTPKCSPACAPTDRRPR